MADQAVPAILNSLLASANRQLVDANRRTKALSGKIDRCEAHLRAALGYPDDARDACLESLAVQAKDRFSPAGQATEQVRVLGLLAEHQPHEWNWSCTCGTMAPADFRTHKAAHHMHLAEVLTAQA